MNRSCRRCRLEVARRAIWPAATTRSFEPSLAHMSSTSCCISQVFGGVVTKEELELVEHQERQRQLAAVISLMVLLEDATNVSSVRSLHLREVGQEPVEDGAG